MSSKSFNTVSQYDLVCNGLSEQVLTQNAQLPSTQQADGTTNNAPGTVDGYIHSSTGTIPYHFKSCFSQSLPAQQCHTVALIGCQYVSVMIDVIRRRLAPTVFEAISTRKCMSQLSILLNLLDRCSNSHMAALGRCKVYPPVEPKLIHAMVLNESTVEMTVRAKVSGIEFWIALALEYRKRGWVCTSADIG